uniref:Glycine-rich domain-containing protein n=1 Tax=viral metagenome TaxID=1070528 RepID=A0A6C0LDQ4_9ZZZZ
MIEKCSIGNMSYNIQNITLIILILILIIVIIYYLKNSSTKHNELIEKYTTPTDIKSDESYNTHSAIANSEINSQFPTSGTEVTLRPCQVQFNNTFDNANNTVRYFYQDGWQEIATIKEPGLNSTYIDVPEKIISRSNETNQDAITNYSERSKCFRRITATDNKYRYRGNALINYSTGIHSQLKVGPSGVNENYMEMKFNLGTSQEERNSYFTNLKNSICSLIYTDKLGGTSLDNLGLYRLTLDADNTIIAINQITINSANNHIFTVSPTTSFADLLSSSDRDTSYVYSGDKFIFQSNSTLSIDRNYINIKIYNFNRELLCSDIQKNIKSYTIVDNKRIDVNKIVNISAGNVSVTIDNTNFPDAASSYDSKNALKQAIENKIIAEIATANADAISNETIANTNIATYTATRDTFLTSIDTRDKFLDKIFDNTILVSRRNFLVSTSGLINGLNLNILGYQVEDISSGETILNSSEEPSFQKIINNTPANIYETIVYRYNGIGNFSEYDIIFPPNTDCKILIVGGGGGGGQFGGGGGGGAILFKDNLILNGKYIIKVGKGGNGQDWGRFGINGDNGEQSSFQKENVASETYIAKGGGGGGTRHWCISSGCWLGVNGNSGGSGGGGSHSNDPNYRGQGGVSNKNTYAGWQDFGYSGGKGRAGTGGGEPSHASGGGGGAGSAGEDAVNSRGGGHGGRGKEFITTFGSSVGHNGWFAGGGGGNTYYGAGNPGYGNGGNGLLGGGGNGGYDPGLPATDGVNGTGGGGGGGKWATGNAIKGGNGGSGVVIIKYRVLPAQDGDNHKKITLKYDNEQYDNKLNFTYRTDESLYSWEEAYNEAIANGKRMPTIKEMRDYMDSSPNVFSAFNGKDVWIPVLNPGTYRGRDWVQAGNLYHTRKKSHTQDLGSYPSWGNGTSADYAKVYFEVNNLNSIIYNFNNRNDLQSWINYARSIGATTNVNSFDSAYGVWYPNNPEGYLSLTLNNASYNYITVHFECTYPNGSVVLRINNEVKETCFPNQFKIYSQSYNIGDVLTIAELNTSIIGRNLIIILENRIINYRATLPIQTSVTLNGEAKTLDAGIYNITMGPLKTVIKKNNTNNEIGSYTHTDGNKFTFKYATSLSLQQLHNLSTPFSGAVDTIVEDRKYFLGDKTLDMTTKYKVYIYHRSNITHTITLYADTTLLTNVTDYIISSVVDEVVSNKIKLETYTITIKENIEGNIYLKSDKPIFYINETNRTTFNNLTDTAFSNNVNNLKTSGSATLTSLNNMFDISTANAAKATAVEQKITYNIDAASSLTIAYNSSTIDNTRRTSLNNLKTTYNNIHNYNESSGGTMTPIINTNTFGSILEPVATNIEEYISYEFPSAPSADQLTPSSRTTAFDIKSNATKYIYFKKI